MNEGRNGLHDPMERSATLIGERYRVVRRLGSGAMGDVVEAEDRRLSDRKVAVKFINRELAARNPEAIERFRREVALLSTLGHPNVARILDASAVDSPVPYYVMEFIDGASLQDYVRERQPSLRERLRLMVDACRGVSYLHAMGILHRDLKPANIMVRKLSTDERPSALVVDLGLAIPARELERATGIQRRIAGTPAYLAPEHFLMPPNELDQRSDVHALGVTLFNLVTEAFPYRTDVTSWAELQYEICEASQLAPSEILPGLAPDLETIVMTALVRDRRARYGTCSELGDDLQHWLQHLPVQAYLLGRPDGLKPNAIERASYRTAKAFERRPAAAWASVAGAILLLALAGITAYSQYDRGRAVGEMTALATERTAIGQRETRFLDRVQQIVAWTTQGAFEEAESAIAAAMSDHELSGQHRETLRAMRGLLVTARTLHEMPAAGPLAGCLLPSFAETPRGGRSVGDAWRSAGEREAVADMLGEMREDGEVSFEPYLPPQENAAPTIQLAAFLVGLDQYKDAAALLDRVPEEARSDFRYRHTTSILRARRIVSETGDRHELAAARAALVALIEEAETDASFRREVPGLLYDLAMITLRLGERSEADRLLVRATEHGETPPAARTWLARARGAITGVVP